MPGEDRAGHERWMRAALNLGRRSMGRTAPNPAVAGLVVKNGIVFGRGVTAPGGRPHAEPLALAEAGDAARGATLYVTLEPCSHYGRTPPCTQGIIAAGVATVVYGLGDPDARVAGRGLAQLRQAGVEIVGPVLADEARRDHRGHVLRVTAGRPAVTVKLAETADGFAARAAGRERLLITGQDANAAVHRMRSLHDAVMVGSGTALADDPLLTVRLPGVAPQPARVALDSRLRLGVDSALVRSVDMAALIVVTAEHADPGRRHALERAGVTVLHAPLAKGRLDLLEALRVLARHGLTRLFCEGGPTLASLLLDGGWVDTLMLITGAEALRGAGIPALSEAGRRRLADPAHYSQRIDQPLGRDRLRSYERIETCSPGS